MTEQDPPKIVFPCPDYPVKILGDASDDMVAFVLATTETFAPGFDRSRVKINPSSKGRFHSVTVLITATGVEQLSDYHKALTQSSLVKMVL